MPVIVFTADPKLPNDLKHLGYKKGTEVELPSDACERWLRRGVAIYKPAIPRADTAIELPLAPAAPAPVPVEEIATEIAVVPAPEESDAVRRPAPHRPRR